MEKFYTTTILTNVGGKGKKCRHCGNQTLHWISYVPNTEKKQDIRKCSICNAVLITGLY